jgi:hypothetical protein
MDKKQAAPPTAVSSLDATVPPNAAINAVDSKGRIMRFLLRMAFWLTLVLVLLPSGGARSPSKVNLSASDAISAAKATVSDVGSFCERQRDACAVGSQAAVAIGHRAQAGAKMLYEYLNDQLGSNEADAVASTRNATTVPLPPGRRSRDTLAPADLVPPWRGPQPRKEGRTDGPA